LALVGDDELVVRLIEFHDARLSYMEEILDLLCEADARLNDTSVRYLAPIRAAERSGGSMVELPRPVPVLS